MRRAVAGLLAVVVVLTMVTWLAVVPVLTVGVPQALAQDRMSRTIRVGLVVAAPQVRVTARGQHELWNLASGAAVGRAETGAVWEMTPLPQGIKVVLYPVKVAAPPGQQDILGDPQVMGIFTGPLRVKVVGAPPADQVSVSLGGFPLPLAPGMGAERGPAIPETGFLWCKGYRYRGEIEVYRDGQGLTAVNVLPLEEYLYGVVGIEMSPSWPAEALKAQAVAARTYAVGRLGGGGPGSGFDLLDTPVHQAYRGIGVEDPRSNAAVDATRGQVLTYQGALARTFYHAASGGHTENVENVWTSPVPYLRGVPDFDQDSPWSRWEKEVSLADIGRAMAEAGHDVGEVYRVEPAGPRGVSGRWTKLAVIGSRGQVVLPASTFYLRVGLRSAKFDMEPREPGMADYVRPAPLKNPVAVLDGSGRVASLDLSRAAVFTPGGTVDLKEVLRRVAPPPPVREEEKPQLPEGPTAGAPPAQTLPPGAPPWLYPPGAPALPEPTQPGPAQPPAPPPEPELVAFLVGRRLLPARIYFAGSGWGHGVGMSQYGAKSLAERGHNYQQILQYYYRGTTLQSTGQVTVQSAPAP